MKPLVLRNVTRLNERVKLPDGMPFLVYDSEYDFWSLWKGEVMHVSNSGTVYEDLEAASGPWGEYAVAVTITHAEFETAKMAARHLPNMAAWARFCHRLTAVDELLTNA